MRLAILSDIHANLEALRAVLQDISTRAVDQIVCLGDVVGYNANPSECIALLRDLGPLWVAGNHDRAVAGQISTEGFPPAAARAIAWTRRRLSAESIEFLAGLPLKANIDHHLVAVHGALHPDIGCEYVRLDNDERRRLSLESLIVHPSGSHICAFGNTHHLGVFELRDNVVRARREDEICLHDNAYYLINPGTVGQPRTADRRATYMILDTTRQVLTVERVEYDALVTFAKTRKAGLLPRFSTAPAVIRAPLGRILRGLGLYELIKRTVR